jgi:hypothetical protein
MGDFLLAACDPAFCSPTGPGLPFGTWYLALFDSLRLFTVLGALALMLALGMAWARSVPHGGQRDRYLALAFFSVVIIGTEIENIGNVASYRLVLSILGLLFAFRGLLKFRHETPVGGDNEQPV